MQKYRGLSAPLLCLSLVGFSAFAEGVNKEPESSSYTEPSYLNNPIISLAGGAIWEAMNPGETPDTAEAPGCNGELVGIAGSLNTTQAHVFLIGVTAANFGASTVGTPGTLGDTMLALFDADGNGVYFDDDAEKSGTLRSRLPVGHPLGPRADGCYYLAITGFSRHPASPTGLIWNPMPYTVVRAPDGPGAPGPLTAFTGSHAGGSYTIALTGTECSCGAVGLTGVVTDADTGDGILGARVTAVGGVTRFSVTGANGVYRLRIPAGTYDVTASAFGYASQTVTGVVVTEEVETMQDFALTAADSHSVSGTVTNSVTELPVRGAQVRILGTPLPPATTDADGFYRFPVVADGTYNIQATAPGFRPSTQPITVDQDLVVDFTLDPAADCARVAGNLVANCGFDSGDFTSWTRTGELSGTVVDRVSAHSGDFGLNIGPRFSLGFVAQNLPTTPGGSYSLCYWRRHLAASPSNRFQVIWDGKILLEDSDLPVSIYVQNCIDVVAKGDSTELKFGFRDDSSAFYFDDVSVAPQ